MLELLQVWNRQRNIRVAEHKTWPLLKFHWPGGLVAAATLLLFRRPSNPTLWLTSATPLPFITITKGGEIYRKYIPHPHPEAFPLKGLDLCIWFYLFFTWLFGKLFSIWFCYFFRIKKIVKSFMVRLGWKNETILLEISAFFDLFFIRFQPKSNQLLISMQQNYMWNFVLIFTLIF